MRNAKKIRTTKGKDLPVDLFESQVTFHCRNEWGFVSVNNKRTSNLNISLSCILCSHGMWTENTLELYRQLNPGLLRKPGK